MTHLPPGQLGFDSLLNAADAENRTRKFARETAHLPETMAQALPFYRVLLRQHHAAMLAADAEEAQRLRKEGGLLARRLNNGDPGILAHDDAPGRVLTRQSSAVPDAVPLWGQAGTFVIIVDGMQVRIELEGLFGIGCEFSFWPGFAAHAVDRNKPFLSQTGFRSFLGIHADPVAGLQPNEFTQKVIAGYVARALKGRLVAIEPRHYDEGA